MGSTDGARKGCVAGREAEVVKLVIPLRYNNTRRPKIGPIEAGRRSGTTGVPGIAGALNRVKEPDGMLARGGNVGKGARVLFCTPRERPGRTRVDSGQGRSGV